MKTLKKENLFRIGSIQKSSGFKGALIVRLDSEKSGYLKKEKFFFILLEGLPVPFEVEEIEINEDEMIVKFFDIDTEEQARKLSRKEIFTEKIPGKKKLKITGWKDLLGFMVRDVAVGELGNILEVLEYPMQMIARCSVNGKEVLFPLNDEIVLEVLDKEKIAIVELPDGLLDVYLK
jgi:16S rRNA processing protein RimM